MITYKPLWETMKKKGVSTYTLINKHNISSSTIHRLRHDQGVTTQLIDELCMILSCNVEDVIEFIPDEKR